MQIKVTQNEVKINKDILNDGEYNIHKCQFVFDEEYTGLVQKAVFTLNDGTPYLETIFNNECDIPIEVLEEGVLKIGVYAYETDGDELVLRYSPSPDIIHVFDGSYVKDAQNTEPITPTDKEQIEQAITNLQNDLNNKQDTLVSGENIKTINGESVLGSGNIEINTDLSNYYNKQEIDASQSAQNTNISKNADDIATLNNNLTNYSLITETGSQIVLNINSSNYQMTAILKDKNGNTIYTSNVIDLPIESMIVNVTYDSATKEIVFTLQNGTTLRVSVADLVSGLVSTDDLNTILSNYYSKAEIDTLLSGKVDATTYTQGQATQDANIQNNTDSIEDIESLIEQMPTVSGQGTDISLQDVYNYRLMKFLPQGVSSQGSTTGKNLFDGILELGNINNLGNNEPSNSIYRGKNYIQIVENTTYTFSINGVSHRYCLYYYNSNKELVSYTTSLNTGTFTTPSNSSYVRFRCFAADFVSDYANLKIQLEQGSTATSYEPYTGGIPAPNPDYPYPVKSVTGENNLAISNVNLFDKNSSLITNNKRISTSTGGSYSSNGYSISPFIEVKTGTQYNLTSGIQSYYCWYDENERKISGGTWNTGESKTSPSNVKYIKFDFQTSDIANIMFIKGSTTPTTYVEHEEQNYPLSLGNIELNSLPDGTIRDGIVGKPNEWYKREYIGKVVLDGSEGYGKNESETGYISFTISNFMNKIDKTSPANLYSNMLKAIASGNVANTCRIAATGRIVVTFNSDFCDYDISALRTKLQTMYSDNNPLILYIPLAEYADIPITDTTLISQLNDIYNNAHSYNGVTNITTTYEDGNEQMYLDIEALAKGGSTTTETDPIFSASASSGITSSDIANWNGKASTTYVDTAISNAITNTLGGSY